MRGVVAAIFLIGLAGCDSALTSEAKEAVTLTLRDPYSAEFQNIEMGKSSNTVCGEVNSKNAFGAFTGATTFVYSDGRLTMEDDASGLAEIMDHCEGEPYSNAVDRFTREAARNR